MRGIFDLIYYSVTPNTHVWPGYITTNQPTIVMHKRLVLFCVDGAYTDLTNHVLYISRDVSEFVFIYCWLKVEQSSSMT